jgi:superfamily II DNA or RNA helicase
VARWKGFLGNEVHAEATTLAADMKILALGNRVEVYDAPPLAARELRTRLTLPNPRYIGAVRAGKVPIGIEKVLKYYSEPTSQCLVLPAACAGLATGAAKRHGVKYVLEAENRVLPTVGLEFRGVLRLYQTGAVAELGLFDHGVLDAPTGSGKTVMGCARIADVDQPTLVVVHNKLLQRQWVKAARKFLGVEASTLGGDKPTGWRGAVNVAIVNSLRKCANALAPKVGHLVVDECHRVAARSYWRALERFDCKYRTGLSATAYRRDGLDEAIQWALGRIVKVERAGLVRGGSVLPAEVVQRATHFETNIDASEHYQAVIEELVRDSDRNGGIAQEVFTQGGVVTLIMSDRAAHCDELAHRIPGAVSLHAQLRAAPRRQAEAALCSGADRLVVCATTQLIGEGFDLPRADVLMLATPIKFSGRLLQAIGRVLRPSEGKMAGRIVDFCDWSVPVLAAGARARMKTYKQLALDERGEA